MRVHLGKGFWFMRACRVSKTPWGTKPFNLFWACCATPYLKTEWPCHLGNVALDGRAGAGGGLGHLNITAAYLKELGGRGGSDHPLLPRS